MEVLSFQEDDLFKEDFVKTPPKLLKISKVVPPPIKKTVKKVVAYYADNKQPAPAPKQFTVVSAFIPTFITAQNSKPITTTTIQPTTTTPPEVVLQTTTYSPSGETTTTVAPI